MVDSEREKAPEMGCMVLAGQANTGPFSQDFDVTNEALIPASGYSLLTWVLAALKESRYLERIVVVGPEELDQALGSLPDELRDGVDIISPGQSLVDNIRLGHQALSSSDWILISTADIPLVSGAMIDSFIEDCLEREADFFYPVVRREAVESRYPGAERTYVKVGGQVLTGGNVFLTRPAVIPDAMEMVERFYQARKNPLRLAALLGVGYIARFALGRLSLDDLERKISAMVGWPGNVVISGYPEIGLDIDKPAHLPLAEEALRGLLPGGQPRL